MKLLRTAAALVAIAAPITMWTTGASAQANCDWYANTALQQQKVNADRKCGFKGESWSFDRSSHIAWCQSVSPEQWRRQAQFREQELQKCASGARR